MKSVYVDSKDDKEEEIIEETEEIEETIAADETDETDETVEETEETTDETSEDKETEEKEEFDYKTYGKETVEETKNIAEKMFNDVVNTLKSTQSEWNKTLEDYKANKPAVDIFEFDEDLVIKLDAPHVSKEDISIKMSTDYVEIEIEFPECDCEEDVKVLRKERCSGKTKNVIPLPVEVDINEVKAKFEDSELTLTLPKIKGKKVDVEIV